jgi:hypothetical protein
MKSNTNETEIINIGIKSNTAIANIGIILIIFSFLSLIIYFSWQGLSVFIVSVIFVFLPYKLQLDYTDKTYKIFQDFFIIRLGKKLPFSNLKSVHIRKSGASGMLQSTRRISSYNISSFDVVILIKNKQNILVGEYKSHNEAMNRAKKLSENLSIEYVDEIENALKSSREKRKKGNLNYARGIRQKRR